MMVTIFMVAINETVGVDLPYIVHFVVVAFKRGGKVIVKQKNLTKEFITTAPPPHLLLCGEEKHGTRPFNL